MEAIYILLIDSNEKNFLSTKKLIQKISPVKFILKLDWLTDYAQAKTQLLQNTYDLYLIDEFVDGHSGLELIQESYKEGCLKPAILLTNEESLPGNGQIYELGAADYLIKDSLDASQLERSIHYCLAHTKYLQQIEQLNSELEKRVETANKSLLEALRQVKKFNDELKFQIKEKQAVELFLRESQQMLTMIGENFPNGVITVFDKEFNYVYTDGKELEIWDMHKKDFTGKKLSDFLTGKPYELFAEKFRQAFAGEQLSFEYQGSDRMGYGIYRITVVPIHNTKKEIRRILVVTENITKRKQAEEGMKQAIERERELNALKSKFVSMASHEFRTPLSTIATSATLIEKYNDLADEEKVKKHIYRIKSAVLNLTAIMDEFLSINKLEEGKVTVHSMPLHLPSFVREIIDEMESIVKEGQTIYYTPDGTSHELYTDKQLLKNILFNLLSNASKYSASAAEIQVHTHVADGVCTISVRDQGIGIPVADQACLFNQFFRACNVNHIQGTGLGLAIVKRYVELMGGSIAFESKENAGTKFTVTLPVLILS